VRRLVEKRSRDEQPVEIVSLAHVQPGFEQQFGVKYADGSTEYLFALRGDEAPTMEEQLRHIFEVFESFGINMTELLRTAQERRRQEEERRKQERIEAMFASFRAAMDERIWGHQADADSYFGAFAQRDFGRFNDRKAGYTPRDRTNTGRSPPPSYSPERVKALDKCRKLKRLAVSPPSQASAPTPTRSALRSWPRME
jgi:hypothetical protein